MSLKIHREYHAILDSLIKRGKKFSPAKPWPNPTIAVMCIYGWIQRAEFNADWVEITAMGKKMFEEAEVTS